jgi:hypothetical protein
MWRFYGFFWNFCCIKVQIDLLKFCAPYLETSITELDRAKT